MAERTILATLCYLRHDHRTLMIHRVKRAGDIHAGKWNGLGGKCEPGESPEHCVVREVREESALQIQSPRLRGLLLFPGFKGDHWYVFVFTAEQFSGEIHENDEGYLEWIPDTELPALALWPSDQIFFPWLSGERFFSARFLYEGDAMKSYEVAFY